MNHPRRSTRLSCHPVLESLEDRCLPAGGPFTAEPVIPTIDIFMKERLRAVLAQGLQLGNRPHVLAKVGDSNTDTTAFLAELGSPRYNPADPAIAGPYTGLAATVAFFRAIPVDATGANSLNRDSLASHPGWGTLHVLDPVRAPLAVELAVIRPAFVLIMVGTNEVGFEPNLEAYRVRLTAIAELALARGVIPVLSTIPDINGSPLADLRVPQVNQVIAEVADALDVPLWNYWRALQLLPNRGMSADNIHPSRYPGGAGVFTDLGLLYGFNVRNLTALQVLEKLRRIVVENGTPDGAPTPEMQQFVSDLYLTLLRRPPDPAGQTFWSFILGAGVSRERVAREFWHSTEHRGLQVDAYYRDLLHREPDPAGRAHWVAVFRSGASELEVEQAFLNSQEYQVTHTEDLAFVTALYQDLLGREPTPAERSEAEERLENGAERGEIVREVLAGESSHRHVVQEFYAALLDREADPDGTNYWVGLLEGGGATLESVAVAFLASEEFWLSPP